MAHGCIRAELYFKLMVQMGLSVKHELFAQLFFFFFSIWC